MPSDLELRRLAEAATPGPWHVDGGYVSASDTPRGAKVDLFCVSDAGTSDDARYIAAVSPDVLIGLLDRLEAAERMQAHADDMAVSLAWKKLCTVPTSMSGRGMSCPCNDPNCPVARYRKEVPHAP